MNWERIESVRWWGRALLVIAGLLIISSVFILVSAPAFTYEPPKSTVAGVAISAFGYAGMLFGLVWMWRIHRAPTTNDSARWRYRDR
jgi:hypothetical protein